MLYNEEETLEDEIAAMELQEKKKKITNPSECKTAGLKIVAYPTNKDGIKQRPLMEQNIIPRHPARMIFNGASGSGKTNLLVNLMSRKEFFGGYFDRIFLFSPTAGCGDDLSHYLGVKDEHIFTVPREEDLEKILDTQKKIIAERGLGKSPKILIIFEDIQSSGKFMRSKSFLEAFIAGRHSNASVALCSQSFTRTPRACRLQSTNIFFFQGSRSEHNLLCDEFCAPGLTKKEFHAMIDRATKDPYSFMHINKQVHPTFRFRKNLDIMLQLNK